ncbi:hypothetical protein [Halobellus sp. H-GB7]|mgnify:CR=1 FL=1|nr:hypothetical protein [Halobellus sp. H-GB7]MDQ2053211.1 hypothetical protein [Halobellus sp. H-GB7]
MTDETLNETCADCGTQLVRTSEDDVANAHNCAVVTCPSCLSIVRRER